MNTIEMFENTIKACQEFLDNFEIEDTKEWFKYKKKYDDALKEVIASGYYLAFQEYCAKKKVL